MVCGPASSLEKPRTPEPSEPLQARPHPVNPHRPQVWQGLLPGMDRPLVCRGALDAPAHPPGRRHPPSQPARRVSPPRACERGRERAALARGSLRRWHPPRPHPAPMLRACLQGGRSCRAFFRDPCGVRRGSGPRLGHPGGYCGPSPQLRHAAKRASETRQPPVPSVCCDERSALAGWTSSPQSARLVRASPGLPGGECLLLRFRAEGQQPRGRLQGRT